MALDNETVLKLIQQLEVDRQAYLTTFEKVHDTLKQALQPQPNSRRASQSASSALAASSSGLPLSEPLPPPPSRRRTSATSQQPSVILSQTHLGHGSSIFTGDDSSDSDDDESFFAQDLLPKSTFSEGDLIEHLRKHEFDQYSKYILRELLTDIGSLADGVFRSRGHREANHSEADIYHVGTDGAPVRSSHGNSDDGPLATWEALRSTNADISRRQSVGKIIVVREPASSIFAALHLTMNDHFDMDSIYRMLIDDHTPSKAFTKGYSKKDTRQQKSVVFLFKYHTIVGHRREPASYQSHDDDLTLTDDHIPLTTCSSVIGLSLSGKPAYTVRRNNRKNKTGVGKVQDPFAPWTVLSIQCFPDWNHTVDTHETAHHYVNGPDAFMITLLSEYKDAAKRFKIVFKKIQGLATPPNRSIFDSQLRDELLFENNKFTYSRRYFWASQTLALLANEIKDMLAAYKETFTDDFWTGEHKTLFPGTKEQSARYSNWRKKMQHTRKIFEKEIAELEEVYSTFQEQQKQIKALREWLFSGTSVLESREAVSMAKITVEQGYNIRLLTLVTLFYLPLSYVTGVSPPTERTP
jgi:hypothetical protein